MKSERANTGASGIPSMLQTSWYVTTEAEPALVERPDVQPSASLPRSRFRFEPRLFTCRPLAMSARCAEFGSQ